MDLAIILYNDMADDKMTGGADIELVLDDLRFRGEYRMYTDRHKTETRADVVAFSATYKLLEAGVLFSGDLHGGPRLDERS